MDEQRNIVSFFKANPLECIYSSLGIGVGGAWILYLFFCSPGSPDAFQDFGVSLWVPKAAFLLSFCLVGVASMLIAKHFKNTVHLLALWGVTLAVVIIGSFAPPNTLAAIASTLGGALLLALWAIYLFQKKMTTILLGIGIFFSGLLFILIAFTPTDFSDYSALLLPLGSLFLYGALMIPSRSKFTFSTSSDTKWKGFFSVSHFIFMRVLEIMLGIALCAVCLAGNIITVCFLAGIAFACCGLVVFLCANLRLYQYREAIIAILMCCITPPLVLLPLVDQFYAGICGAIILAAVASYKILNFLKYANSIILKPFSELFYFGSLCFLTSLGILIGIILAYIAFDKPPFLIGLSLVVLLAALILTFVLIGCFRQERSVGFDKTDPNSFWRKQVLIVAKHHNLTERQTDILYALSRGRNAKFIEEKYFLSSGTVKTHIRTVYSKLEVHSQQELMDMVRDAKED